jgi:hypothetical protein
MWWLVSNVIFSLPAHIQIDSSRNLSWGGRSVASWLKSILFAPKFAAQLSFFSWIRFSYFVWSSWWLEAWENRHLKDNGLQCNITFLIHPSVGTSIEYNAGVVSAELSSSTLTLNKGHSDMLISSPLTKGKWEGALSDPNLGVILSDHSTWEYVEPVLSNRYPVSPW